MSIPSDVVPSGQEQPEIIQQITAEEGITHAQLSDAVGRYSGSDNLFSESEFEALATDFGMTSTEFAEFLGIDPSQTSLDTDQIAEIIFNECTVTT